MPKTLGEYIRKERTERNIQQQTLAQRFGVQPMYLSMWELNRKPPHPKYLTPILDFLGYVPKLKSTFDQLGTRSQLWRIHNNISLIDFALMADVPLEEIQKIEQARYCKMDSETKKKIERLLKTNITSSCEVIA